MAKSSEQLKKHMILAHNGHKNTTWMFCGDCEYATRVRKPRLNRVADPVGSGKFSPDPYPDMAPIGTLAM